MLNKLNLVDLQMEFTKASELKALLNIVSPRFLTLLAVDISIESILILFMVMGFQGAVSIRKTVLPGMAIPMLKIRRPNGRLIFNMEITIRR